MFDDKAAHTWFDYIWHFEMAVIVLYQLFLPLNGECGMTLSTILLNRSVFPTAD